MKIEITYWLKRLILLVLIMVQVGDVYSTPEVLAGTEITSVESTQGQEFVKAWEVLIDNPVVRLDLPSLEKLSKILDPEKSKKLFAAGFDENFMKTFIEKMNDNATLFSDIADPGKSNGLQVLLNSFEKMEGLQKAAKLALVRSGLQSTNIAQLRGELFRLRRCEDYGWENLSAVEEYIKAAPNSGYTKGRHPDISPLTPPPHFIETKYYSTLLREKTVDVFAKQLHKDLLDVFRIIDEGIVDAPTAFKSYLYEFKKSSEITSTLVLAKQVEDILTKSPWKDQLINGKPLSTIKIELDNLFIQKSGGNFEDLLDFIFESNAFKVIN